MAATFNADETVHQGIEAGLDWTLPVEAFEGSLLLRQTYAFSDFHFVGDARWGDNALPVVPRHQYRAELTWRHPSGFSLTPSRTVAKDTAWLRFEIEMDEFASLLAQAHQMLNDANDVQREDECSCYCASEDAPLPPIEPTLLFAILQRYTRGT